LRFYLDECLSPRVLDPVRAVFHQHLFLDYVTEGLQGTKDIPLFGEIKTRAIDVFLTIDRNQLSAPAEVEAIREGGCNWVGFQHASGRGVSAIARTGAMLLETVAYITDNFPAEPTAYSPRRTGREAKQLFADVKPIALL
jgi:hypothetical protein